MKKLFFLFLVFVAGCDPINASRSDVVFLHGFGYFPSMGMTNMSNRLKEMGVDTVSGSHHVYYENSTKSQILVGHSMGADECLNIAKANPHIKYDLVILIDPFSPIDRPPNIERIVLIRGWGLGAVRAEVEYHFDVSHIWIDDDPRVQDIVCKEVLKYLRWKKTEEIFGGTESGIERKPSGETKGINGQQGQ
jgi:pimeloyl-ACP methyl ester carboxylesterase